ncbi:hypothetical protein SAMN05216503_0598 [Polaribacter sp. KT25b]|uniref:DUF6588 family protein n=1 Tax=Polaribacter sp. KT25b TaxID=1855336 RepID=UPI00087C59CF|nr:DUF6588 family protein [Polaribacter sp. KT25b]SDR72034.1 hypothetical protein SAMN05216503_0598 [Polaribacter sp. KT25b]
MKKSILIFMSIFALSFNTKAQDGFEAILLADVADSQKLLQTYFAPGMEGFLNSMNSGWYHTAKVHKKFGFDLSVGLSASAIPSEKELFNISALALTSVTSTSATASTFGGPSNTTPMTVNTTIDGNNVTANFDAPGGIKEDLPLNSVPAPIAQLNVGLPWKIDAMIRMVPEVNFGEDDGSVKMLGVGIKKEITDWFGPIGKTPLHISLLAAYTTMDVDYGIPDQDFPSNNQAGIEIKNALTEFSLEAFTVQAIASLNFPIINVYGGIGYNNGSSNYKMEGTFKGRYETGNPIQPTIDKTLSVPSNLDFESNGFRTTLGARLSLGFFKIFGSYTLQEYNSISAGIAFSIR